MAGHRDMGSRAARSGRGRLSLAACGAAMMAVFALPAAAERLHRDAEIYALTSEAPLADFHQSVRNVRNALLAPMPPVNPLTEEALLQAEMREPVVRARIGALLRANAGRDRLLRDIENAVRTLETMADARMESALAMRKQGWPSQYPWIDQGINDLRDTLEGLPQARRPRRAARVFAREVEELTGRIESLEIALDQGALLRGTDETARPRTAADEALMQRHRERMEQAEQRDLIRDWDERPFTRLELVRADLGDHVRRMRTIISQIDPDDATLSDHLNLFLASDGLVAAFERLYAMDLSAAVASQQSFPLNEHKVLLEDLSKSLHSVQAVLDWPEKLRELADGYETERRKLSGMMMEYGFDLVLDDTTEAARRRAICFETQSVGRSLTTTPRLHTMVDLDFDFEGGKEFGLPVTRVSADRMVWEEYAPKAYKDGFAPQCRPVRVGNYATERVRDKLEEAARKTMSDIRFRLDRLQTIAVTRTVFQALVPRGADLIKRVDALRKSVRQEVRAVARFGKDLACAPRDNARVSGKGRLKVDMAVEESGRIESVTVRDASEFDGSEYRAERDVRSDFHCREYRAMRIDGEEILAHDRMSITLTESD